MRLTDTDEDMAALRRLVAVTFLPVEAVALRVDHHTPQQYLVDFYGPQITLKDAERRIGELVGMLGQRTRTEPKLAAELYEGVVYYTSDLRSKLISPNREKMFEHMFQAYFPLSPMLAFSLGNVAAFVVEWAFDKTLGSVAEPMVIRYTNAWFEVFEHTGLPIVWA